MTVYLLKDDLIFPPAKLANEDGILALGGDLTVERLLLAYSNGIFPWYSYGEPILWWSPDPRFVIKPDEIKISRSMRQLLKKDPFRLTYDQEFEQVISKCQKPRKNEPDTWITREMKQAYIELHKKGYAHSVEVWQDEKLAGGLYGVSLGKCFFGESMFTEVSNASKVAFISLAHTLLQLDFDIIDCQVYTQHLESLGAYDIPRSEFIDIVHNSIKGETLKGNWGELLT